MRQSPQQHGREAHLNKAKHNRFVAELIDAEHDRCRDWLAITFFYVVIHLVEAYLAAQNIHGRDHEDRMAHIRSQLGQNWEVEYRRLYDRSRDYRYRCKFPTEAELADLLNRSVMPFMKDLCGRLMGAAQTADALFTALKP